MQREGAAPPAPAASRQKLSSGPRCESGTGVRYLEPRSGKRSRWARRTRQVSCRWVVGRKRVMTNDGAVVQIKRCCDCWAAPIAAALTARIAYA